MEKISIDLKPKYTQIKTRIIKKAIETAENQNKNKFKVFKKKKFMIASEISYFLN